VALIVEVLHPRTGAVVTRRRVATFPFTIGRGFDNALVLDDPHVDARHAALTLDPESGDVIAEDLGSVNGIQTDVHERAPLVRVRGGATIRVGRTPLRFRDEAEPLPPAVPLNVPSVHGPARWHERGVVRLAFCAAVFVVLGWLSWLASVTRSGSNEAVTAALGFVMLTAAWAGIWALVARVVIHQGRFLTHFTIATALTLLGMLLGQLGEWVGFLAPDGVIWPLVASVLGLGLLTASVALHLANATHLSRMRRWRAGVIVSAVLVGLGGLFTMVEDDGFTDVPTFSATVLPLRPSLVPTLTPDELRAVHEELRGKVDSLPDARE
jgi:hypothetical protein